MCMRLTLRSFPPNPRINTALAPTESHTDATAATKTAKISES